MSVCVRLSFVFIRVVKNENKREEKNSLNMLNINVRLVKVIWGFVNQNEHFRNIIQLSRRCLHRKDPHLQNTPHGAHNFSLIFMSVN